MKITTSRAAQMHPELPGRGLAAGAAAARCPCLLMLPAHTLPVVLALPPNPRPPLLLRGQRRPRRGDQMQKAPRVIQHPCLKMVPFSASLHLRYGFCVPGSRFHLQYLPPQPHTICTSSKLFPTSAKSGCTGSAAPTRPMGTQLPSKPRKLISICRGTGSPDRLLLA